MDNKQVKEIIDSTKREMERRKLQMELDMWKEILNMAIQNEEFEMASAINHEITGLMPRVQKAMEESKKEREEIMQEMKKELAEMGIDPATVIKALRKKLTEI